MLRKLLDFILLTSLYTACCATGLCMATEQLVTGKPPAVLNYLHLLVFGSTLLVYNLHHALRKQYVKSYGLASISNSPRTWYVLFSITGLIMAGAGIILLPWPIRLACLVLALLSFGYSFPLLPAKKKLRDFGLVKITDLTVVWTIVTAVLPILFCNKNLADYPFEILLRFSFIFTLCMIFDLRDMRDDAANNISTLPNKLGFRNSYRLIDVTLLVFAGLSFVQYMRYPVLPHLAGAMITATITRIVAGYLKQHPSARAYLLLADGLMLVYALCVLLL